MHKSTKTWLVTATLLILIGCIIFGVLMSVLQWDFTKLSTVKYETNIYDIAENFENISVSTDTADILLVPSENTKTKEVCHEQYNAKHSVTIQDGTLFIKFCNTKKWNEYIGINFGAPKITVYLPRSEYGALSVKSVTGDVEIPKDFKFESITISESTGKVTNFASATGTVKIATGTGNIHVVNASAGSLKLSVTTGGVIVSNVFCNGDADIKVSTGKAILTAIACTNLISNGNTGDIFLNNVIATEKISIHRSTGDVKFDGSDAAEIFVKTNTGDVGGSLLTDKVFIANTDTGDVHVPKKTNGGKCEIITSTGNIKFTTELQSTEG